VVLVGTYRANEVAACAPARRLASWPVCPAALHLEGLDRDEIAER
jgi:hypothetical protein